MYAMGGGVVSMKTGGGAVGDGGIGVASLVGVGTGVPSTIVQARVRNIPRDRM
jgi:hypothetical protein